MELWLVVDTAWLLNGPVLCSLFVVFRVNVTMHTRKAGSSYNGFLAQRYGKWIGPHEVISHGPGHSTYIQLVFTGGLVLADVPPFQSCFLLEIGLDCFTDSNLRLLMLSPQTTKQCKLIWKKGGMFEMPFEGKNSTALTCSSTTSGRNFS